MTTAEASRPPQLHELLDEANDLAVDVLEGRAEPQRLLDTLDRAYLHSKRAAGETLDGHEIADLKRLDEQTQTEEAP